MSRADTLATRLMDDLSLHHDANHMEMSAWFEREITFEDGPRMEIDRRQRMAAAFLLCAFDLPAEAIGVARQMIEAASVCPGMTTGDVGGMLDKGNRKSKLLAARRLIDAMLLDILP